MLPASVTTRTACKLPATVQGNTSPLIAETHSTPPSSHPKSAGVVERPNSSVNTAATSAGHGERGRSPRSHL